MRENRRERGGSTIPVFSFIWVLSRPISATSPAKVDFISVRLPPSSLIPHCHSPHAPSPCHRPPPPPLPSNIERSLCFLSISLTSCPSRPPVDILRYIYGAVTSFTGTGGEFIESPGDDVVFSCSVLEAEGGTSSAFRPFFAVFSAERSGRLCVFCQRTDSELGIELDWSCQTPAYRVRH